MPFHPQKKVSVKEQRPMSMSHMFSIAQLKRWVHCKKRKHKWRLLACDLNAVLISYIRQRRVGLLRDQILTRMQPGNEGGEAAQPAGTPSASGSTGQEVEHSKTGGDDWEIEANSSRLKHTPVI
jgi:hypothetical protein